MKRFLILLILCSITLQIIACNGGIKLIASKKQTVIQGFKESKPYTKYLFEIALDNTVDVKVDSVILFNAEHCVKVNHNITKNTENKSLTIHAPLHDGNYKVLKKNYKSATEKVLIHYKVNNRSGKLKVSAFQNETVTRR